MIRILIVDDEAIERAGLRFLLSRRAGEIEIVEADSGESALRELSQRKIDIIITDIRMPFMDGLELARRVRAFDSSVTIAIYTAYGQFEYAQKGIDYGVCAYLLKPIDPRLFHVEVDKMIARALSVRESLAHAHTRAEGFSEFLRTGNVLPWFEHVLRRDGLDASGLRAYIFALRFENDFFLIGTRSDDIRTELRTYAEVAWLLDSATAMALVFPDGGEGGAMEAARWLQECVRRRFGTLPSILAAEALGLESLYKINRAVCEKSAMMQEANGAIAFCEESGQAEKRESCQQADALRRGVKDSLKNEDAATALSGMRSLAALAVEKIGAEEVYIRQTVVECLREISDYLNPQSGLPREALEKIWFSKNASELKKILDECMGVFADTGEEDNAVGRILRMIHERYSEDLRLDEIAREMYMTPNYVNFLFKRKTGQTIMRYVCLYRMERAAQLLRDTNKRVTDIMLETGYNNASYFSSIFHAQYGCTPSQYRKGFREGGGA